MSRPAAKPKKAIDKGYYHEGADRTYIIQSNIEDFLQKHPSVEGNKSLEKKLEKVQEILSEVYQELGAKM